MNIFVVASKPDIAARMLCDAHVVKMTLETAQILSTVWHSYNAKPGHGYELLAATHNTHPCVQWAKKSKANYEWTALHGLELAREYVKRFGRAHACTMLMAALQRAPYAIYSGGLTPFVQCMPEPYKRPADAVGAYRAYYLGEKMRFARWRHTEPPYWVPKNYRQ